MLVGRGSGISAHDVAVAADVMRRYSNRAIGLADARIVVLADRHGIRDVLTLDERHFRALRGTHGRRFRELPADRSPAVESRGGRERAYG